MALASVDFLFTLPFGIYNLTTNVTNRAAGQIQPWRGWDDTHYNFSRVGQYAAGQWRSQPQLEMSLELTRWFPIICAFLFVIFFGFTKEAQDSYSRTFRRVFQRHRSQASETIHSTSNWNPDVYVTLFITSCFVS